MLGVLVDFTGLLRQGEVLTGTPSLSVSGPTVSSPAVTTAVHLANGQTVAPGKGVTFVYTGGSDGSDYLVLVSCATSASRLRYAGC